jgi:hypothetical protein
VVFISKYYSGCSTRLKILVGHVARMGDKNNMCTVVVRESLEDLELDGNRILIRILSNRWDQAQVL